MRCMMHDSLTVSSAAFDDFCKQGTRCQFGHDATKKSEFWIGFGRFPSRLSSKSSNTLRTWSARFALPVGIFGLCTTRTTAARSGPPSEGRKMSPTMKVLSLNVSSCDLVFVVFELFKNGRAKCAIYAGPWPLKRYSPSACPKSMPERAHGHDSMFATMRVLLQVIAPPPTALNCHQPTCHNTVRSMGKG